MVEVGHNHFVTSLAKTVARQILIEHGAKVNKADEDGWTPLHFAVYFEHPGLVKVHSSHLLLSSFPYCLLQLLLDEDADVHAVRNDGNTPLHIAAESGRPEIVKASQRYHLKAKCCIADSA